VWWLAATMSGGWRWVRVWVRKCSGRVDGAGGECWGQVGKVMGRWGNNDLK
jgi:hypothetical protein